MDPVRYIVHVADLHIRLEGASRTEEYDCVIRLLVERVRDYAREATTIVVVAGDVFHNKGRLDSTSGKHAFQWFNALLDVAPVFVICGNHDYRQDEPDVPDAIEMLEAPYLQGTRPHALHYLRETGAISWRNLSISTVSIKDALTPRCTSGSVPAEELPKFPPRLSEDATAIAIFHGTVKTRETAIFGAYPIEWFDRGRFDAVLLGDNHKQQVHREPSGMAWGYPGSLVQQDFGEPTEGHGFLLWTLPKGPGAGEIAVTAHHLPNPYGFMTLYSEALLRGGAGGIWADAGAPVQRRPRVRVMVSAEHQHRAEDIELRAAALLESRGCRPTSIKLVAASATSGAGAGGAQGPGGGGPCAPPDHGAICEAVSPQVMREFIGKDLADESWVLRPGDGGLMVPSPRDLPSVISEQIAARNARVQAQADAYRAEASHESQDAATLLRPSAAMNITRMRWANLMCYGEDNVVEFEAIRGRVALLSGPNACGKTSFLDVVCLALFGDPTPARSGASRVVRHGFARGWVSMWLSDRHLIHREFSRTKDGSCRASAARVTMVDGKECVAEGVRKVNEWVGKWIGSVNDILMSAILCQNSSHDFFNLRAAEQCAILDRAARMSTVTAYETLVHEALKAHKHIAAQLTTYISGIRAATSCPADLAREEAAAAAPARESEPLEPLLQERQSILRDIARLGCTDHQQRQQPAQDFRSLDEIVERQETLEARLRAEQASVARWSEQLASRPIIDLTEAEAEAEADDPGASSPSEFSPEPPRPSLLSCEKESRNQGDDPERLREVAQNVRVEMECLLRAHGSELRAPGPSRSPDPPRPGRKLLRDIRREWETALGDRPRVIDSRMTLSALSDLGEPADIDVEDIEWHDQAYSAWKASIYDPWRRDVLPHATATGEALQARKLALERGIQRRDMIAEVERLEAQTIELNPECPACMRQPQCVRLRDLRRALLEGGEEEESESPGLPGLLPEKELRYVAEIAIPARKTYEERAAQVCREREAWRAAAKAAVESEERLRAWRERRAGPILRELLEALGERLQDVQGRAEAAEKLRARAEWGAWLASELRARARVRARLAEARSSRLPALSDALSALSAGKAAFFKSRLEPALAAVDARIALSMQAQQRSLRLRSVEALLRDVRERVDGLQRLLDRLIGSVELGGGFKDHVYSARVLPLIESKMNEVITCCSGAAFSVLVRPSAKTRIQFSIVLKQLPEPLSLDHASGFQRFLVALAMRLALVALGAARTGLRHLFLDEGFTACDSSNLVRAGEMLRDLATHSGLLDSIVVMSHLEAIQDAAHVRMPVTRGPGGAARLAM